MKSYQRAVWCAFGLTLMTSGWIACSLSAPSDGELMGGGTGGSVPTDGSKLDTSQDGAGKDGDAQDVSKDGQTQDVTSDKPADQVADLSTDPIADVKPVDADADADGEAATTCPPGKKPCQNQCVPTDQPTTGCGNVDCQPCTFAHASAMCESTQCKMEKCVFGYGDCNSSAADGCEVNLQADPQNCESCTHSCPPGTGVAICTAGVCGVSNCAPGTGNCDNDDTNGCETDTSSSVAHCGVCGNPCSFANGNATCVNAACTLESCSTGFGNCDNNVTNGCETDTSASMAHCGTCGNGCTAKPNATVNCTAGACGLVCTGSFKDCDNDPANGCESNSLTDKANCGQCANSCATPNPPSCQNGTCDCPPVKGNYVIGQPHFQYGFCWYLTAGGRSCDQACLSLGGTNLALSAANAFPDSCAAPTAGDLSTWFFQNGNPGGWVGTTSTTTRKTFGHGGGAIAYVGKCAAGTAMLTGAFPGDPNNSATRNLVCPCF